MFTILDIIQHMQENKSSIGIQTQRRKLHADERGSSNPSTRINPFIVVHFAFRHFADSTLGKRIQGVMKLKI